MTNPPKSIDGLDQRIKDVRGLVFFTGGVLVAHILLKGLVDTLLPTQVQCAEVLSKQRTLADSVAYVIHHRACTEQLKQPNGAPKQ